MTEEQKPTSDFVEEIHSLGEQLTKALKALLEEVFKDEQLG